MHVQSERDFPQSKLDGEIDSPFLLNKHGHPRIFFQVFAKNSLLKNIFQEEKKSLIVEHDFFSENSSQLGAFWPRRGLQADHRTVLKSAIFLTLSNQKQLK